MEEATEIARLSFFLGNPVSVHDSCTKRRTDTITPTKRRTDTGLRRDPDYTETRITVRTETEFAHILSTFPLVPDPVKVTAQNAYRDVERGLVR